MISIPVAGGFYFRVLPLWFINLAIRAVNRFRPAVIYLHPWETFPATPRLREMPYSNKLVSYWGINHTLAKLEGLLREFKFVPVTEILHRLEVSNGR